MACAMWTRRSYPDYSENWLKTQDDIAIRACCAARLLAIMRHTRPRWTRDVVGIPIPPTEELVCIPPVVIDHLIRRLGSAHRVVATGLASPPAAGP